MLGRLIVKILLRLLLPKGMGGFQPKQYDDAKVRRWLAESFVRDEFRWHFAKRDYALMKRMSGGIEGKDYWIAYGRRLELLELLGAMRVEHEAEERKRKER